MKGKFVVIDGNDGSGKTTQLGLLKESLEKQGKPVATFDFPQYNTFHGNMVGKFLNGDFGPLDNVSPYLITYPYAMDRAAAKPAMEKALLEGKIVLANRYVTSNFAHQSGRLPKDERHAFVDWNMEFEYEQNGIPKEDLVTYLYVPHKVSQELMKNKDRENREYLKGKQVDMVEGDEVYLSGSEQAFQELMERFDHWIQITCTDEKGEMRSREDIHQEIVETLKKREII